MIQTMFTDESKRFADWVTCTILVVHLSERTETGGPDYRIGPDYADRA